METLTTGIRICAKCETEKTLDCFPQRKTRNGRLIYRGECKTCRQNQQDEWRKVNPEKQKAAARRANVKRRDSGASKLAKRKYRLIAKGHSPDTAKDLAKTTSHDRKNEARYDALAVKNAKQAWKFWIQTKATDDWVLLYYAAAGKPWASPRLTETERYRIRYRLDPEFNLKERIRLKMKKMARLEKVGCLIRGALARGGRSPRAEKLLGYSIAELKIRLEAQFTKGMTWEKFNSGEIHIDHIVPISAFDFEAEGDAEWRSCWCYTNLRPLWAHENLAKGATRTHLL